jgi:hypothetical protein
MFGIVDGFLATIPLLSFLPPLIGIPHVDVAAPDVFSAAMISLAQSIQSL